MEKKIVKIDISETDFVKLVQRSKEGDHEAFLQIVDLFEEEMIELAKYIKMPKEDVLQSLKLGLLELIVDPLQEERKEQS
ncbi:hypothetical protein SAMN05428961_11713 [Paenibacillus sp. OK060]|uniref:helix-turn-helix domain-containing protein n=1 Tax=Paenibacillus sp. OK060 TaxID=1881034 RepID=UPI0008925B90|nr:helix-turn-helix domain-containing protein [Paenibacillus sp. OK060]SDM41897.1 hypothetical protein SAMN05428961_11713 [Paenibacillus sp. OK060]